MKKIIAVGLATAGLVASTWVSADYKGSHDSDHKRIEMKERQDRRIERLKTDLNLTSDQEGRIRALFEEQHKKMRAIREETHKKLEAVLTPEQRAKFESLKEERHQKYKQDR